MGREYSNKRSSRARSSASNQFLIIAVTFLLGYFTATVCDIETISRWINTQVLAHHEARKAPTKPQAQQQAETPPKPKFEFYTLLANEKVPNSEKAATTQQASANTTTSQTTSAATTVAVKATNPTVAAQAQTTPINTAATSSAVKTIASTSKPPQQPVAVKVAGAKPAMPAAATGRGMYSVQVASFKARHDAEHMKGLLTLKGFSVSVIPINHATRGVWFRVVVGPYANRNLAQRAQMDLARNERLRGMITAG